MVEAVVGEDLVRIQTRHGMMYWWSFQAMISVSYSRAEFHARDDMLGQF
jgi:hypothetical protein